MIMLMSILILSCISCENLGNFGGSRSQAQAYPLSSHVNGNATIVAIETISRSQSIGLGTLAGAAVGGLLGYQVGGGTGKTVTTIAGAAGGAYVGHELEKQRNKDDRVYKVTLRMDDGTMQSFAQESEPILKQGDRVKISNGVVTKL
jgi:outer membrane lipoprotein SlyB